MRQPDETPGMPAVPPQLVSLLFGWLSELIIEGIARGFVRIFDRDPAFADRVITRMAELRSEVLTPDEAAELVGQDRRWLRRHGAEVGIVKSNALGHNNPRYYRSQILAAIHSKDVIPVGTNGSNGKHRKEVVAVS